MSPAFTMFKAIAVASFLGQAAAHIVMANPQPFAAEYMATSPLASDGSNFPCKYTGPSTYVANHMNEMTVGQDQLLSFNGSASHGGGTCQLAVTLDTAPTKSSVWKNIQVYEGGCPVVGNGNDGTKTFKFQIPAGFPNGKATFSWVWNNRIGNREIYMSCAPINVSGGSDNGKDFYNSLPDLYVVNMPPEQCTVAENGNLIIPNPGQHVIRDTSAPGSFISATGSGCAAAKAYSGGGGNAAPGTSAAAGTTAATTAAGTQYTGNDPAPTGTASGPQPITIIPINTSTLGAGGNVPGNKGAGSPTGLITIITKTTGGATGGATAAPTTSAGSDSSSNTGNDSSSGANPGSNAGAGSGGTYAPPTAPPSSGSSQPAPPSSGSASGGGTCNASNDGQVVCNGTSQFGLCNHGGVVWQSVAAGTQCVGGQIQKREEVEEEKREESAVAVDRAARHPHWGGRRF